MEVNEYLLAHKDDDKDDHTPPSGGKTNDDGTGRPVFHFICKENGLRFIM